MPSNPSKAASFQPKTRSEWRRWLRDNHASSVGVSLILVKKGSAAVGISYEDAVGEALCFGWIDSRTNTVDAQHYRLQMTPRKPGSVWSKINKRRVEELIEAGRMTDVGLAKIEAARRDGSWDRLDAVDLLEIPPDLKRALSENPKAKRNFEGFSVSSKRIILYWITAAKRSETRQKRVNETVRLAAENVKAAHPRE